MIRFSVLASGSSGNAALLQADGFGLLLDAGLGPRQLASRLAAVGASWSNVHAALLTHTHGDHWRDRTLAHLRQRRVPFYCHAEHHLGLQAFGCGFSALLAADLVRPYERGQELWLSPNLRCLPLEVSHDSTPTFGFRFDASGGLFGSPRSVGFLSDLGCWTPQLAEAVADVDILALEFNHDELMERHSRRPMLLIERVLGDFGHLSNDQAAALLRAILERSGVEKVQHLVQLHLSRECNRPLLAQSSARRAIEELQRTATIHTAAQFQAGPIIVLDEKVKSPKRTSTRPRRFRETQPSLPGME